jgi:hypothetical protein
MSKYKTIDIVVSKDQLKNVEKSRQVRDKSVNSTKTGFTDLIPKLRDPLTGRMKREK